MKWFKHMASAHDDERLAGLRDEGGFEAYGFYWFILEVIAKQVDEHDKCSVEYPIKHWQRITGFYPKKLQRLLKVLEMFGLCLVNVSANSIKVECPKLLEIRDNHSKNLQAKNKSKSKNIKDNTNVLSKTPPEKKVSAEKSKGTRLSANWVLPTDWGEWALAEGLTRDVVLVEEEKFRDYWLARAGPNGVKRDWYATWRNWIRRLKENGV